MKPTERRARLAQLAGVAERNGQRDSWRGWRDLVRWCVHQIARLVIFEARR